MIELEIYIDGASKGNPGPSGIGAVIIKEGRVIKSISRYIGEGTNNVAEYSALLAALDEAHKTKASVVKIYSDSQLLCRQLQRTYKVKSPGIAPLFLRAVEQLALFKRFYIINIPREKNTIADKLATAAVVRHFKSGGSANSKQAECGRPVSTGRKVRAPEDSALCNTEVSPQLDLWR